MIYVSKTNMNISNYKPALLSFFRYYISGIILVVVAMVLLPSLTFSTTWQEKVEASVLWPQTFYRWFLFSGSYTETSIGWFLLSTAIVFVVIGLLIWMISHFLKNVI